MFAAAMLSVTVVANSATTVHHTPAFKVVNQAAIDMLASCDSKQCYQLQRKISRQKELQDEKTADDLASYF